MRRTLSKLKERWQADWPPAIAAWSQFVQMHEPVWCETRQQEKAAQLTGSFAMIRLVDHSVVISLRQIAALGLQAFSQEILAHEIGHHVLCPADLTDNARMLSRMRRGLPGVEAYAPMISNLYADLLINDRLQRSASLDMAGVYRAIEEPTDSKLWQLYMRMYELLWKLPPQTLVHGEIEPRLNQDAQLGARLIRSYARDWLDGAGRFACLCFPYVEKEQEACSRAFRIWCDTIGAGVGGFPDGLSEEDEDEADSIMHPAEDPALSGLEDPSIGKGGAGRVRGKDSGRKSQKSPRGPFEYSEILQATGVKMSPREIAIRFYRERALPHLIPFPARAIAQATDPIPEGLDTWEISSPIEQIDWWATLLGGADVIPGVTTRERLVGQSPGTEPERIPLDLYLGIDCSGSMRDPAFNLSYPVLAGTIMVLSALRAGARVKVVLSGEPGRSVSTEGFIRDADACLQVLTNYLGTGYAFGIHRLAETFSAEGLPTPPKRPAHALIISDNDMFSMLEQKAGGRVGWDVAREAVTLCGGGATYVLQIPESMRSRFEAADSPLSRMQADGWRVHLIDNMEELTAFARQFSHAQYAEASG